MLYSSASSAIQACSLFGLVSASFHLTVPHTRTTHLFGLSQADTDSIQAAGGPRAQVYGEMTDCGLRSLFQRLQVTRDDSFLDLGSGHGALVISAMREFDLRHSMGVELSLDRHTVAVQNAGDANVSLVHGDATGPKAVAFLQIATIVYCSNLLFNDDLNQRILRHISAHGDRNVRALVSLKEFPGGIPGMTLDPQQFPVEMSWTAGRHQAGHPPLPGHPCCIYTRQNV